MREVLDELRMAGPTVLDVTDADERDTAVVRTIEASLSRLTIDQRDRYLELAVFGDDVAIPGSVLVSYWNNTGGWSQFQTQRYCQRLADLSLVSDYWRDPDQLLLHDVIRAYLREQTRHQRGELNRALIDAHRSMVPIHGQVSAWWQLPAAQSYLWTWLLSHLREAGLDQELRACLHDARWLVRKLENTGPATLEADLALSDDPISQTLAIAVRQNAHVLGPLQPPGSLAATLATRLPVDGPTKAVVQQMLIELAGPHLRALVTVPDLPHPALTRMLTGHIGRVRALVAAPDGSWLASAGYGGQVRICDSVTGAVRHTLASHTSMVRALVTAPDGSWLVSAGHGGQVEIWDSVTGTLRHTLASHPREASVLVVAPDGSWLASPADDGEVRIWDPASGITRHTLTRHPEDVSALAVAPDGSWLASAGGGEIRIWDPTSGNILQIFTGPLHGTPTLVAAPDGSWLASAGYGGQIWIWDPTTGTTRHTLTGHTTTVSGLAVAPDGSWLASAGGGELRIWNLTTGLGQR
jgi:hypothetical protein